MILFFLFVVSGIAFAQPDEKMAAADAAYAQRSDLSQAKKALGLYEELLKVDPANAELDWKLARAAWWVGENSSSKADKLRYFQRGIDVVRAGLNVNPNSVETHFWLGANLGSYGDTRGVLKSLSLVKPVRHEMAEVLRLNNHYDSGAAYHVLAVVDYKVPAFAGGSKKRARQELDKAMSIDANDPDLRFYRAEYFATIADRTAALSELDLLDHMVVAEEKKPELALMRRHGNALRHELR